MKKKLQELFSDQFLRNSGWLGFAALMSRISRLVTTLILARIFSTADYGSIAVIYTTFAFGDVFALRGGIGSKIVQAKAEDLEDICQTSYWLNWILCTSVFLIQALAAFPIAKFYKNDQLILPVIVVGLIYLILPNFMVQSSLILRENRLKIIALNQATLSIITNLMTAIFAFLNFGVWAAVWAMIISYFMQIFINNYFHAWRPKKQFNISKWREVMGFGLNILGVSLLEQIRGNLDYLIVGGFLGVEALGLYYFAFNAGIGISNNIIQVFTSSIYPYLCIVNDNMQELKKRFIGSLKKTSLIVIPLILVQAGLAPFYVPIIFGEKWIPAIPILVVICLSALPLAIYNPTIQLLNAIDKTKLTLYWSVIFTAVFGSCLLIAVNFGIMTVAFSVLACQFLTIFFCIWVIRFVFYKQYSTINNE
jgi:O-antigen/teichoic acid export membrane protein